MPSNAPALHSEDAERLLRQGVAAARSGQRERARELLMRVVEQDEENLPAWLWLSGVVDTLDDREVCLENVLALDPNHDAARKGLVLMRQQRVDQLLRQGIAAAKSSQRERARELLTRVVEQDEENVSAWLWLSGVVDSLDDRAVCLENVLALDPSHEVARQGLAMLRRQKEAEAPPPAEADAVSPVLNSAPVSEPGAPPFSVPVEADDLEPDYVEPDALFPAASEPGPSDASHTQSALAPPDVVYPPDAVHPPDEEYAPDAIYPPSSSPVEMDTYPATAPESEPSHVSDELDDEYLCPYCAAPTEPRDRRCKACDHKLWVSFRKREERSVWMWIALILQAFSVLQSAVLPVVLSLFLFDVGGREFSAAISEMIRMYARLLDIPSATIEMWLRVAFVVGVMLFLLSLTVLIGLFLRWKPIYYLYLANAVLMLFLTIANALQYVLPSDPSAGLLGGGGLFCTGLNVLAALAGVGVVFQLQDDFPFERRRILLRLDRDVVSGPIILARGHEYAGRKMWALAALHMRRATARMPDRIDGRAALALTYLRLKRYDLAARTLADARRIASDDPDIAEVQELLDEMRAADKRRRRT
jgi:tetratricopeptide (TPR) repeat protein